MPIDYSYVDPIFQADPTRYAAALANFSGPPAPDQVTGQAQATSADLSRILELFRSGGMSPDTLYAQLRSIGYSAELAMNVVDNLVAERQTQTQTAGLAGAAGPGLLGGATGSTGPGLTPGDISGATGFGGPVSGGGMLTEELTGGVGPWGGVMERPDDLTARQEALFNQDPYPAWWRAGTEVFNPRSALRNKILSGLINRFQETSPITQFGMNAWGADPEANRFRQFLKSPRPTGAQLGSQLAKIIGTAGLAPIGTPESAQFEESFENFDANTDWGRIAPAFQAGIQPFVQALSPFVQSSMAKVLERQFRELMAQNPSGFTGGRDLFAELQRRKFIPSYVPGQ